MRVEVHFPRVLAPIVGTDLHGAIDVDGAAELRDRLEEVWPGITNHLFDSTGAMRPHVLCFVDDTAHRLDGTPPIRENSEIRFVQAVSGG